MRSVFPFSVFSFFPSTLQDERTRAYLWIDQKVPPTENYKLKEQKNAVITKGIILGEGGDPKIRQVCQKKKVSSG